MRVVDDFSFMSIVEAEIIKKASGKPFDKIMHKSINAGSSSKDSGAAVSKSR